jgi:hypothetical protein
MNLPPEIRTIIWRLSLAPRVVELRYNAGGFFSDIIDPPALRVCQGSRNAVIDLYPRCFGAFYRPPRTRFNLALDTLYLSEEVEKNDKKILLLFAGFRDLEISGLQYLALDPINICLRWHGEVFDCMLRAVSGLRGLNELIIPWSSMHLVNRLPEPLHKAGSLEFLDTLPEELAKGYYFRNRLPQMVLGRYVGEQAAQLWGVKQVRTGYIWRRGWNILLEKA